MKIDISRCNKAITQFCVSPKYYKYELLARGRVRTDLVIKDLFEQSFRVWVSF